MADKQAQPRADDARAFTTCISYFAAPDRRGAALASPVIEVRQPSLRAIWCAERGPAKAVAR